MGGDWSWGWSPRDSINSILIKEMLHSSLVPSPCEATRSRTQKGTLTGPRWPPVLGLPARRTVNRFPQLCVTASPEALRRCAACPVNVSPSGVGQFQRQTGRACAQGPSPTGQKGKKSTESRQRNRYVYDCCRDSGYTGD